MIFGVESSVNLYQGQAPHARRHILPMQPAILYAPGPGE